MDPYTESKSPASDEAGLLLSFKTYDNFFLLIAKR